MIYLDSHKYQTIHLSLYFIDKIESDAYLYRFLLARMLTRYTKTYFNQQLLANKLHSLYGTFITHHVFVLAGYHIMRFNFVFPNPEVLDDQTMMDDLILIIKEMFFDRELFKQSVFDEAKKYTINHIISKKDHKFGYAKTSFMHYTFLNHPYGLPITGKLEDAKAVSLTEVYDYYQNYFLKNDLKIYVSGKLSPALKAKLDNLTHFDRQSISNALIEVDAPKGAKLYSEYTQMGQAYIFLSYYIDVNRASNFYMPTLLTNMLIGGFPESVLYKVLRETHYLAYDLDSRFEYDKKHIMIYAGVKLENQKFAYELMMETLHNLILDGVTDALLNEAKDYLKNEIYSSLDFQDSMIPKQFSQDILGYNESLSDLILKIDQTTATDILTILQKMTLSTTYILSGGKDEII